MIHLSFSLIHVCTYGLIVSAILCGISVVLARSYRGGLETFGVIAYFAYPAVVIGTVSLIGLVVTALLHGWMPGLVG